MKRAHPRKEAAREIAINLPIERFPDSIVRTARPLLSASQRPPGERGLAGKQQPRRSFLFLAALAELQIAVHHRAASFAPRAMPQRLKVSL